MVHSLLKTILQILFCLANSNFCQEITKESYVEFQERVVNTFRALPFETVNKTIASIDKRLEMIKEKKGNRIKY